MRLHRDGTFSDGDGHVLGYWTRHYNGLEDRGVKLGPWQGCVKGGEDSPIFDKKRDLIAWLDERIKAPS